MNEMGLPPHVADRLTSWLNDEAGTARPEHLDEVIASLEHVRQRPAWSSPGRWLPMQPTFARVDVPRFLPQLVVALLVIIALAAVLVAGGPRPLPPPFGLAAAGSLVLDADGVLLRIDPLTGAAEPFGSLPDRQYGATWSRDGLRVAFWSGGARLADGTATQAELWVADADGRNARSILGDRTFTTYELFPAVSWSPDSRRMAFATSDGDLWVVDADGANLHRIGGDALGRCCPAWSPDGEWIAFNASAEKAFVGMPDGQEDLLVARPDGSNETTVSSGRIALPFADWSPDGSSLLYTVERGAIAVATPTSAGWTERIIVDADLSIGNYFPRWSNAGDRFAYFRDTRLIVADADGANRKLVETNGWVNVAWPCWSPDDRLLVAFQTDNPSGFVEFEDSASAVVVDMAANEQIADIAIPRVSGTLACSWQRLPPG